MASRDSGKSTWDSFLSSQTSGLDTPMSWWGGGNGIPEQWTYDYNPSKAGISYDPVMGATTTIYQPLHAYTQNLIDYNIDTYMQQKYPELYQFNTTAGGGMATAGRVGTLPNFGGLDNQADAYIQQAANQYGVPANFLKSFIMRESTGIWSDPIHSPNAVAMQSRPGASIFGY